MSSLYIVTLAEMRAELKIGDDADDALLTNWMAGLQDRIDQHCERKLLRAEDTEYFNGGETYLYLRRFPVESIASVHVDHDQVWDAGALLTTDSYRLRADRGRVGYGVAGNEFWPRGAGSCRW